MSELAKRAVACKGWRWMPGMQTGPRREDGEPDGAICLDPWRVKNDGVPGPYADDPAWEAWPDPDDPATLGCLLALVREAWGKPGIHARRRGVGIWAVYADPWLKQKPLGRGDTEAEALVAALEAAP